MSKNFVILGTARSGTTFFAKTLQQQPDVWIPSFTNLEPFNPFNMDRAVAQYGTHLYDQDAVVQSIIKQGTDQGYKYVGFKTFMVFHPDMLGLIERNQLDVFVMLRKDIWKILASHLIAIDNSDFSGSSTKYKPYRYDNSPREARRVLSLFNELCKALWWMENVFNRHPRLIHKFYLEDVDQAPLSFDPVDNYFDRSIVLDYNYNNDVDISHYIENYDEFQSLIRNWCKKMPQHYSALPDYVRDQLEL